MAHACVQDVSLLERQAFASAAKIPDEPSQRREAVNQVNRVHQSNLVMLPIHSMTWRAGKAIPFQ